MYRMVHRVCEPKFFTFIMNLLFAALYYKFHFPISLRLVVLLIIIILSADAYRIILLLSYIGTVVRRKDIAYPDLVGSFFLLLTLWALGDL